MHVVSRSAGGAEEVQECRRCRGGAGVQEVAHLSLGSTSLNYCPFGAGMYACGEQECRRWHIFRSVPLRYFFSFAGSFGPSNGHPIGHPCGHPIGHPLFKK